MLLVACGLLSEAKIARGSAGAGLHVVAGGGDASRLLSALADAAPRCQGVLSFGVAGGLAPGLRPGAVRVADAVIAPDGSRRAADPAWAQRLVACLRCPPPETFACVERPLADPLEKAALHRESGAVLVDMESSLAAEVAAAHALPFAALRVVIDAADHELPAAVAVSMKPGGSLNIPAILWSIVKRPGQVPGLVRTGRDSREAFAALLRCRQLLGPGFALLDLG